MTGIRDVQAEDREAFLDMWADFVSLAPDEPGNHGVMGELNWSRMIDPAHALKALIATDENGAAVGFTLYLPFAFTWARGDVCYLQDIYVRAQARGKGIAQAMIAELEKRGRDAGWFKVFWMTQADNFTAQRVYDKVAKRMDYLRYDLNVCEP
ncbi:MAG: GNAT family N-acetyltransferase [Rhizobiaceae bacterium]|nr:GNAT family N-acetyltransferase [Rhizobiaceae bacterium]